MHGFFAPDPELAALKALNAELVKALEGLVGDIDSLIDESIGVTGLHRNGDVAGWESLCDGGDFEGWLTALNPARATIAKAKEMRNE